MIRIIVLLMVFSTPCYGELSGLRGYILTRSTQTLYKISLIAKRHPEKLVLPKQQIMDYNKKFKVSTGVVSYPIRFMIRTLKTDKSYLDDIKTKAINFLKTNGSTILRGELYEHRCFHDRLNGKNAPCIEKLVWEKK